VWHHVATVGRQEAANRGLTPCLTGKPNSSIPGHGRPDIAIVHLKCQALGSRNEALAGAHAPRVMVRRAGRLADLTRTNGTLVTDDQFAAACALAPYSHPKLTAVAVRDMRLDTSAQIECHAHFSDSDPAFGRLGGRPSRRWGCYDRPVVVAGSSDEVAGHVGVGRTGWDRGSKPGSKVRTGNCGGYD
jgi:hypothetical protein